MSRKVIRKKHCYYCGKRLSRRNWSTDHKRPVSRGGSEKTANKVDACKTCNVLKGCLLLEEFRAAMAVAKGVLKDIPFKFYGEKGSNPETTAPLG